MNLGEKLQVRQTTVFYWLKEIERGAGLNVFTQNCLKSCQNTQNARESTLRRNKYCLYLVLDTCSGKSKVFHHKLRNLISNIVNVKI